MKNIIIATFLSLIAIECKKDEAVTDSAKPTEIIASHTDSASISNNNSADKTVENKAINVETINETADLGKTIFTENGKTIISFNSENQKGKIRINGKDYELNKLTFSENNYEIKGPEVSITAINGTFQEMVSDCAYGVFPEVKVSLNHNTTVLKNIKVQDCPNYN